MLIAKNKKIARFALNGEIYEITYQFIKLCI